MIQKEKAMTILITGATGLIGQEIVKQCHAEGINVHYLTTSKSKLTKDHNYKGFYWNPKNNEIDQSNDQHGNPDGCKIQYFEGF